MGGTNRSAAWTYLSYNLTTQKTSVLGKTTGDNFCWTTNPFLATERSRCNAVSTRPKTDILILGLVQGLPYRPNCNAHAHEVWNSNMTCMPYVDYHFFQKCPERSHSWLWKFVAMETTLTLPHFIPGKRAGETSMNTDTEIGLKETARNLVGCFNNEAKANYQESPAVFTGKRASVVEEAEEKMGESAIHWFLGSGFYLSLGPAKVAVKKKKKQRNKMQQLSLQAFWWLLEFYCQMLDTPNFYTDDSDIVRERRR